VAGSAVRDIAAAAMSPARNIGTVNANGATFDSGAQLITDDNGWRYYTGGTAVDPSGAYYYQGEQVWAPGDYQ
jgi:hypothetical protein